MANPESDNYDKRFTAFEVDDLQELPSIVVKKLGLEEGKRYSFEVRVQEIKR